MDTITSSFFKDVVVGETASKFGFVVLDANILYEIEKIFHFINSEYPLDRSYFSYSLLEFEYEKKKQLQFQLKSLLQNFYENFFFDYKTLNESFLIKPAHSTEEFLMHQDFCYTDERKFDSYNIWIPLTNVTEQNGALFFLPGSHLWFKNYRSASLPTSRISMKHFRPEQIVKVELNQGQVVLFHPAVFHGSYPNLSEENRIIITSTVMHKLAPFIYYHQEEADCEVEMYELDEDTYLRDLKTISKKGRPNSSLIKRFTYQHHILAESELLARAAPKL